MDITVLLLSAVLVAGLCATCSASVELPFDGAPDVRLDFELAGDQPEWKCESSNPDSALYTWRGHTLSLHLDKAAEHTVVRMELRAPKAGSLDVKSYSVRSAGPAATYHAVMIPGVGPIAHLLDYFGEHHKWPRDQKLYRCLVPEAFREAAQTNSDAPYILLTDSKGANGLLVGWTAADRTTTLKGEPSGDNYALTITRREDLPFSGEVLRDSLVIDTAPKPWFDAAAAYARRFDAENKRKYDNLPDWATDPVFCTWYCYLDHIDQEGLLKIARKCKELGFGTILIDAGWDSRSDGGFADFKHGILGDYVAVKERFPDLPGAIREMHEMGLRVELWSAPFWEGKESQAYREKTKDWHVWTSEGENHSLCPKHPKLRDYLRERFAWIARTYGVDGMWLDAADSVPPVCVAKHEHIDRPMGEAFVDCLAACPEGLRSVRPDAVTEARVLHGNINTKRALDLVQPSDAPESFEILRLQSIHIRPWIQGRQLKNDPMYWKKKADVATIGKFMATMMMCGVPALSVDYLTAPEEHCRLTAVWLDFYKKHKRTLLRGECRLFGADYGSPDMMLVSPEEAVIYVKNPETREAKLPREVKRIIVFNVTDSDTIRLDIAEAKGKWTAQCYKPDWSTDGEAVSLSATHSLTVNMPVPQGGSVVIERT